MKTKLLVALITCVALTACSKHEGKDEKKAGEGTTATQPAHGSQPAAPAGTPHSMNQEPTTLAADQNALAAAQDATSNAATDAEKKVEDMKQDMSNTSSHVQGSDASTTTNNTATDTKADTHSHNED